jgi:hypothetical protein
LSFPTKHPSRCHTNAYSRTIEILVLRDRLGLFKDFVCDTFGCRATVLHVVLDTKVIVGSTGVVAGGEEDATIRLALADQVGPSGRGENTVLADDELLDAVSGTDLENRLHGLLHEEPAVTADDEGVGDGVKSIEDCLNEVLGIVLQRHVSTCCFESDQADMRSPAAGRS